MVYTVKSTPMEGLSPAEIYMLCGAVDIEALFGLEDKKTVFIKTKADVLKLKVSLQEKELLNPEGRLTKKGALLIKALEIYSKSKAYARINNLSIALSKSRKEDNVVILFEDEPEVSYRLELWPRKRVISLLMDVYDFFRRPAKTRDFEYLIRDMEGQDLERVKTMDLIGRPVINFEWFRRPGKRDEKIGYEHKLFFADGDKIVQLDAVHRDYAYISLFYLYKQVFDWLGIPYGREVLTDNEPQHQLSGNGRNPETARGHH